MAVSVRTHVVSVHGTSPRSFDLILCGAEVTFIGLDPTQQGSQGPPTWAHGRVGHDEMLDWTMTLDSSNRLGDLVATCLDSLPRHAGGNMHAAAPESVRRPSGTPNTDRRQHA